MEQDGVSAKANHFLRGRWVFVPAVLAVFIGFFGWLFARDWNESNPLVFNVLGALVLGGLALMTYFKLTNAKSKVDQYDLASGERWLAAFDAQEDDNDPDNQFIMVPIRLILTNRRLIVEYPSYRTPWPIVEFPRVRDPIVEPNRIVGLVPVPLSDVISASSVLRSKGVLLGSEAPCVFVSMKQFGPVKLESKPDSLIGSVLNAGQRAHTDRYFFFADKTSADKFEAELKKAIRACKD